MCRVRVLHTVCAAGRANLLVHGIDTRGQEHRALPLQRRVLHERSVGVHSGAEQLVLVKVAGAVARAIVGARVEAVGQIGGHLPLDIPALTGLICAGHLLLRSLQCDADGAEDGRVLLAARKKEEEGQRRTGRAHEQKVLRRRAGRAGERVAAESHR